MVDANVGVVGHQVSVNGVCLGVRNMSSRDSYRCSTYVTDKVMLLGRW